MNDHDIATNVNDDRDRHHDNNDNSNDGDDNDYKEIKKSSKKHKRKRRHRSRSPSDDRRHRRRRRRSRSSDRRHHRHHRRRSSSSRRRHKHSSPSPSPPPPPLSSKQDNTEEKPIADTKQQPSVRDRGRRTILVYQLHPKIDERALFDFFSVVGQVDDVRLIRDPRTGKSKGLAYLEFAAIESVQLALALNGQELGGYPISITETQAEKNDLPDKPSVSHGGLRLYVGSLHFNVTEEDLQPLFEAFGDIDFIELNRDPLSGLSRGFGFVQYRDASNAQAAMSKLNGLDVGGRQMRVSLSNDTDTQTAVAEMAQSTAYYGSVVSTDRLDESGDTGLKMGIMDRQALMAKLQRKPVETTTDSTTKPQQQQQQQEEQVVAQPSTCIVIANMFDPDEEEDDDFDVEIGDDVRDECSKYGKIKHIFVDKRNKNGHVYVRFDTIEGATQASKEFEGRYFGKRLIQTYFVPEATYEAKFPKSRK